MFIIITHYTTGTDSSPQRVSRSQLQGFRTSSGSCRVGSLCYWLPVTYILGMPYTWMFPRCGTIVSLNIGRRGLVMISQGTSIEEVRHMCNGSASKGHILKIQKSWQRAC